MISTLLFSVHLVAALAIIASGLKVMEDTDLFRPGRTWAQRRDDSAVCLAWLFLGIGAFISMLAYVFEMQGLGGANSLANPMILLGAAMLLTTEGYRVGRP